ncbi:MAG: hypothetical protein FWC96_10100 [Oscillospiraceae bacterium]|nr:hypothetical protein [Oscillospiraceae bacterium]
MSNTQLYEERLKRVQDAIALKEPDSVPLVIRVTGAPYFLYEEVGGSHATSYYDFDKTAEAFIKFHEEFQPDIRSTPNSQSGPANEILKPAMIDWPGRPGTIVPDFSTHQVLEDEYLLQEEYDEFINEYPDFILRKFIPRAFPEMKALENFKFAPTLLMGTNAFTNMLNDDVKAMMQNFIAIIDEHQKYMQQTSALDKKLDDMGYPAFQNGMCVVPYDYMSDNFRGVMGIFEDILEIPEKVRQACDMVADRQIEYLSYLEHAPMPFKRVFFPLHKGMDGFMSPEQYHELYWEPYQKVLKYLVSIGVTPFIYTEGPYFSRIDYIRERLQELPRGSCFIHFEQGDFAELKKKFEGIACLMGGIPMYDLQYGKKENVVDRIKYLIDNCAAGGGYLMSGAAAFEKVKRENFEAMFDTARTYGKK